MGTSSDFPKNTYLLLITFSLWSCQLSLSDPSQVLTDKQMCPAPLARRPPAASGLSGRIWLPCLILRGCFLTRSLYPVPLLEVSAVLVNCLAPAAPAKMLGLNVVVCKAEARRWHSEVGGVLWVTFLLEGSLNSHSMQQPSVSSGNVDLEPPRAG